MSSRGVAALLLGLLAVLATSCSDDGDTPEARAESSPTTLAPGTYATETFLQPFTITVPDGWTSIERRPELVQFWDGDDEEKALMELTLLVESGTLDEVVDRYRGTAALETTEPTFVQFGRHDAVAFDGDASAETLMSGEYQVRKGGHVRIVVLETPGGTVAAVLDSFTDIPGPGTKEQRISERTTQLEKVLDTIDFLET